MKTFIIFIISILLASTIIFSCGDDTGTGFQDGGNFRADVDGRDGDGIINGNVEVVCRGDYSGCSDSECCGEDNDCLGKCRDLFSGGTISDCRDNYSIERVNQLDNIVGNIFDRPTGNKLYEDEDLKDSEALCTLLELSPETWTKEVKDYTSPTYARTMLEWIVSQNIWYYFLSDGDESLSSIKNEDNRDHLVELMEQLIGKLGGAHAGESITDTYLLNGLTRQEVDGEKTIFYLANNERKHKNTGFYFVHNEFVVEKVCDEGSNRPDPNTTGTTKYTGQQQLKVAEGFDEEACILAVYCKAGPATDNQYKTERKNVARLLGEAVSDFIETPIADGGLGIDDDVSEWPNEACVKLRQYWKNGSSLNLGL